MKPGYKLTNVGVIPEDWDAVLLDSVAKRGSGHTPDKAHPEYWGGTIKWVSLQDSDRLDRLYIWDTAAKITPAGIANSSARMHPQGTVVLSRDAGVGKSAIMKDDMAVSQHFMAWTCGPSLNNHFLYYWLQSNKFEFERIAMGNTIKTIGLPYFRQLVVPLPTKAEQEAIAEALSDADALVESLEQLLTKKREVKQGAMQELLTGTRRLPGFSGKWEMKQLGDVIDSFVGGGTPSRSNQQYWGGRIPWVTVKDFATFNPHHSQETITTDGLQNSAAHLIPAGTLITSTRMALGKAVVYEVDVAINQDLKALFPKPGLSTQYLFLWFQYHGPSIEELGSGSTVKGIALTDLKKIEVQLPSRPEQTGIAAILFDMDAEIAVLEAKQTKARQLRQGMMQELLTGRIRLI